MAMTDSQKIEEAMRAFRAELLQACAPPRGRPDATPVVVVTSAIVAGQHLRDSLVAIMAGTPYPWANTKPFAAVDGAGYTLRIGGDCRMDGLSEHPMARSECQKCGYTLTTNEAPQKWKCPIDGEILGSVPYP
jgi:hypothetical protein